MEDLDDDLRALESGRRGDKSKHGRSMCLPGPGFIRPLHWDLQYLLHLRISHTGHIGSVENTKFKTIKMEKEPMEVVNYSKTISLVLSLRDRGIPLRLSNNIAGVSVEIRTEHLPNTSQERCFHTNSSGKA
jgi:hypothetical protein